MVSFIKLELLSVIVWDSFINLATTCFETGFIQRSSKKISVIITKVKNEQKSKHLSITIYDKSNIRHIFECVDSTNLNKKYLMVVFGKLVIRHIYCKMVFCCNYLVLNLELTVQRIYVEWCYYASPGS